MTQVQDIMSTTPCRCYPSDSLNRAAQLMWEHDCGCVPVVDHLDRIVGIVTDRDICMGAYTQGRSLAEIVVSSVCAQKVHTCSPSDPLEKAEVSMIQHQVRRLPVADPDGHLVGVLSLSDLARHLHVVTPAKNDGTGALALSLVMEAVSRWRRALRSDDKNKQAREPKRPSSNRPRSKASA